MSDDIRLILQQVDRGWFDMTSVENIVRATDVEQPEHETLLLLCHRLDQIVAESMRHQLRNAPDSSTLDRMIRQIKAFQNVQQELERLRDAGVLDLVTPLWPIRDSDRAIRILSELRTRRIRGRAEAWESVFFPRVLGLYAAVFGVAPSGYWNVARETPGPTVVFVQAVIEHTIVMQRRSGYGQTLAGLRRKELTWYAPDPKSTARKIAKHTHRPIRQVTEQLPWEVFRDAYQNSHPDRLA